MYEVKKYARYVVLALVGLGFLTACSVIGNEVCLLKQYTVIDHKKDDKDVYHLNKQPLP